MELSPQARAIAEALEPIARQTADTILPHHAESLADSAISPEVAATRGYRSVKNARHLIELGFTEQQARTPALLIPIYNVRGELAGYQIRPYDPRHTKDGKTLKYEAPKGSKNLIDVPPAINQLLDHSYSPLLITEGSKKADALASLGVAALSLPGVYGWRGRNQNGGNTALPDWEYIAFKDGNTPRQVGLAFDSDVITKKPVNQALRRLKSFLESRGATVGIQVLPSGPGEKVGIDDWIAQGHTLEDIAAITQRDLPDIPLESPPKYYKVGPIPNGNGNDGNGNGNGHLPTPPVEPRNTTDLGNSERLVDQHGHEICYVPSWGWLQWDGKRWTRLGMEAPTVERMAANVVRSIYNEAANAADSQRRQELADHARKSEGIARIRAMVDGARTMVLRGIDEFDADPMMLNVLNGTIDLRTGQLYPHDPKRLISKVAPVTYDPDAKCPQWLEFQNRITAGSDDLLRWKQRYWGYCLTGLTVEQCVAIYYGRGANGKSVEIETAMALLGDYATRAEFSSFVERKQENGQPRNDIARLFGSRFVSAVEAGSGQRFSEALIKQITGEDTITARFLHKEFFDFKPTFKITLATNHKPVIKGVDDGIWRRIRLVPFTVTIPVAERDPYLAYRLRHELPGILNWAIQGCFDWQKEGLGIAEEINQATNSYRAEMDTVGEFLNGSCVLQDGISAPAAALYEAYEKWCNESGEHSMSKTAFGRALQERGLERTKGAKGTRYWLGVALKTETGGTVARGGTENGNSQHVLGQGQFTGITRPNAPQTQTRHPSKTPPGIDPNDVGEI